MILTHPVFGLKKKQKQVDIPHRGKTYTKCIEKRITPFEN
jgi:hypothetical protein